MTMKTEAGGPVAAEAEAVASIDEAGLEEIKAAAEEYRARKEAPPEVDTSRKAQQLHQAAADLEYYSRLVRERTAQIKQLAAELNDSDDVSLRAIADIINKT